jgi:hypothetical protein
LHLQARFRIEFHSAYATKVVPMNCFRWLLVVYVS